VKITVQNFEELLTETLSERAWNKDSNTPRDYDKEYNPPGSKEQDERNKRKRDKRKHDKEHGECPDGEELHHVGGIEDDEVKCEPVSNNRGRKEKSRLKKGEKKKPEEKAEIVIKITKKELRQMIQKEIEKALNEVDDLPVVAMKKLTDPEAKLTPVQRKKAIKDATDEPTLPAQQMAQQTKNTKIASYDDLGDMINHVLSQASKKPLRGDPSKVKLPDQEFMKQLKVAEAMEPEAGAISDVLDQYFIDLMEGARGRQLIYAEGKNQLNEWDWEDAGHLALDFAGLIPFAGPGFDIANAIWYASKGEYLMASLSIVATVPIVGDILGLGSKAIIKLGSGGGKAVVWMGKKIAPHMPQIMSSFDKLGRKVPKLAAAIPKMKAALKKLLDWSVLNPGRADQLAAWMRKNKIKYKGPRGVDQTLGREGMGAAATPFMHGASKKMGRRQARGRYGRAGASRAVQRELVRYGPLSIPGRVYDRMTDKKKGKISAMDQQELRNELTRLAEIGTPASMKAAQKIWDIPDFDRVAFEKQYLR